jgi:hypothetical protein
VHLIDRYRTLILRIEAYSRRRFIRRGSSHRCGIFRLTLKNEMGLISKSGDRGEASEKLINGSEWNIRVPSGGTPLGTSNVSVLRPAETKLASMICQGQKG